jgi:hypothetical protein
MQCITPGFPIGFPCDEKRGIMMSTIAKEPQVTKDGVAFSVIVEYQQHDCIISQEVLANLSHSTDEKIDALATYNAFQAKITGVARRMAKAGVTTSPMVLTTQNFG